MTSKEALDLIKPKYAFLLPSTIKWTEAYSVIEEELKKPQELYNKIKDKRDKARIKKEEYLRRIDILDEEIRQIRAEICTYNEILFIMESMFEGLGLENEKIH